MPVVLPEAPARLNRSASELGSTTTERLGAQFAGAFEDNPVPLVMRLNDIASANRRGNFIPRADAQRIAEQNGAMLDLPGDGVSSEALDIMIESALKRQRRQAVIESAPQGMGVAAAGFATELGAGLLDPAGFALNFVPVVGQSTRLALATNSARVSTRLGARTAVGAIEGAVGQAMVEPLTGYVYRQEGREYGAMDAATNIAFGTVLGSTAHNILGGGGDLWRTFRGEAHPWSLPGTIPLPPDVPVLPDATPDPMLGQGAIYGAQTKVKIGDAYQPARWAVVDAADVEATMEKADNQFRDRTRAASGAQIEAIARDIDFEYLNAHPDMASGAPTLSRDGKIIGGNGRAAAISMAYDLPSGMAYSGPMRERLTEWGVRPEQVQGMRKPMLVRVLEGDVDVRAAAIASNETGTLKMSALEQAKVDGERLGRVDLVAGAEGRLDIAENRGPIRRWVEQFPESERASLMDAQGNLSAEGSRRLQNAALHQAFGDSPLLARMVDSKDPGMGRVSSALLRSSGKIAEVRGAVARGDLHDVDLGPDIVAAVERMAWLRDQGMTVEMYLRQGDLLGDGLSPEARRLLAFLGENMDSARRMADGLTRFYEAVEAAGDPKQADMFGESVAPDKATLLDQALADAEGDRSTAAAKMDAASPATREAALVTASSQMLEGKMPDVQALVDADPAIGQATFADIEATAKRIDEPQALRTADPVASQQVAERAASIPKAWGSETAKAERERVGAELQMLEAAQGDAWKYARKSMAEVVPEDQKLIVMHSTSADKLRGALDLGGLPAPSLGITKGDTPYSDFGGVSFIGRAGLVDPKRTPVFDSDIYSARAPKVMRDAVRGVASKFDAEFREGSKTYDDRLDLNLSQAVENGDLDRAKYYLESSPVSQAAFLQSVNVEAAPVLAKNEGQGLTADARIVQIAKSGSFDAAIPGSPEYKAIADALRSAIDEYPGREGVRKSLADRFFDERGELYYGPADRLFRDARRTGEELLDASATREKLAAAIEPRKAEFQKWIDAKLAPAFKAPYIEKGGRKVPATLENVVAVMKREALQGSEKTMTYGPGRVRAEAARRYRSLEEIKADRAKVVAPAIEEAAKDAGSKLLDAYRSKMAETYEIKNYRGQIDYFGAFDASMKLLSDIEKGRGTETDIRAAFKRNDFADPSPELMQEARDALETILSNPVQYLEAKPLRAVGFEEFAGAVVPSDLDADLRARLEEKGVRLAEYDTAIPGDRERVVAQFSRDLDAGTGDVRFARGGTDTPLQDPILLREALATSFGTSTDAILRAGQVEIVGKVSDLPARADGGEHPIDVSAMTAPDGRVWIVAENASPAMARGLVLHEVGIHVGLEPMLGRQGFDDVLAQVDRLLESGDDVALLARSAVPEDTPSHLIREETLAYLVQHHPELPLVQRILAAVRAWAYKNFEFARDKMELTAADLQALAVSAVRRVARDAEARRGASPGVRYSRGPIEVPNSKDELAPFREAEARADKYAKAVRAAAARWGSDVEMRAAIEKASGGEIVGKEAENLIEVLRQRHRDVVRGLRKMSAGSQAQDMAAGLQDAAMQAADMLAEAEVRAAAVEHRNAMLSLAARTRALSYVKANFAGREIEGLKALVAGTEFLREGGRSSAALEIKQFEGAWMGGIVNDLTKAGLWEHFARDAYAADVARALWQHSLPEPDFAGIHPDAKRIADVLTRYQSDARATQNRFGAWIGDLSGWMYRQAHDMHKMRKAGSAGWKDYVRTRLDWDRIREQLGVVDAEKFDTEAFLDAAWLDLSNGQHFKPDSITEIKASVGPSNIAKRVSQSRALHWKDADAAFGYLQAFGPGEGSLAETVLGGFHGSAKAAGLMKVFGPNYEANINAVSDQLQQDLLGTKQGDSWRSQSKEVMDLLHHVDGSLSIPDKEVLAKAGSILRAWQSMAKLGSAVVSQISDVPVFAASIAHRFDVGLLPGLRDAMSGLLQGRSKGERLEILHECGYYYESLARMTFARFDPASDVPGAMSAAMEKFFKWGGITWWTETLRSTAVLTTARRLGDVHRKGFDALPKATRDMLGLYKIDAGRWDLLRMGSTRAADGAVYMTAEGVRVVPDAAISSYLKASGRPVSDAAVVNMRTDLEASMRSLFLDQSEYAVLEPSARSRQLLLRGTQAGTWEGEAFRMFAQFKSFPVVYAQKVFGREIQGRGYDTLGQYIRSGDTKAFGAFLGLMVSLTASGYLAGMAKDLLKLRSPKPVDDPRTWIAAFMQGGSLGIYGDFLFGNMSRFGTGAVETLAGPVPSALLGSKGLYSLLSDSIWGTVGKAVEGEDVEPADLGAAWLRYAENNTPFMNLHVLRPALNALLFWKLEEALNPGSLRRAEKRLQKETGSTMLVSPSEFVR